MPLRLVLDTHAWLWHSLGSPKLGPIARTQIDAAVNQHEVWISVASCWEVGQLVAAGKFVLTQTVRSWMHQSICKMRLGVIELRRRQVMDAIDRIGILTTKDPFDSFIVSAAIRRGATLVTADGKITAYAVSTGNVAVMNARN